MANQVSDSDSAQKITTITPTRLSGPPSATKSALAHGLWESTRSSATTAEDQSLGGQDGHRRTRWPSVSRGSWGRTRSSTSWLWGEALMRSHPESARPSTKADGPSNPAWLATLSSQHYPGECPAHSEHPWEPPRRAVSGRKQETAARNSRFLKGRQ